MKYSVLSLSFMILAANLSPGRADGTPSNLAQLAPHLSLLNELSPQRRTQRFFVNEQIPLYGVQEGYVNVGRGNLTFLNRDLVTVGRIPIVAGRVYDSSASDIGHFGPGWRFSLSETVVREKDDSFIYTDESGSPHGLHLTAQGLKPIHAALAMFTQRVLGQGRLNCCCAPVGVRYLVRLESITV